MGQHKLDFGLFNQERKRSAAQATEDMVPGSTCGGNGLSSTTVLRNACAEKTGHAT